MSILEEIQARINAFKDHIAQAIHDGDWSTVGWNVALVLAVVMVAVALAVGTLALVGKILGTLLGKVLAVPLVLFVLGLSYKYNLEDSHKARQTERDADTLERWAEQVYGYVRDSTYYVVQAMAGRVRLIIKPNAPWDIEMQNRFFRQGEHMVFQFFVQLLGPMEKPRFEQKLTDCMVQLHREGRLVGITSELVEINNLPYCPLQVLNVEPYDDGYVVQIVYADEDTVTTVKRGQQRQRKSPSQKFFDDEL